ncbi:hypothetical protein Goarm_011219 [Gossypium armourianum]|uniref:Uncharacterized protein n=1 Tax=Gossypium armourianum TaxID=34283 RepID=A0A7J9IW61_9ROSI|nr:hypothetical protein [Gossypium armourianum]
MPPHTSCKCLAPKHARGESSSAPLDHPSIIECFEDSDSFEKFNIYFATRTVQISCPADLNFLANTLKFKYLDQLRYWGWLKCLQLRGPCYDNLVRAFYSNAKLRHDLNTHLVQSITFFVMGQEITISVETLSTYFSITNEDDDHHTGSYDTSLTRLNDYLDDEGNWVCKFDQQSSVAQALTVPPVALQSSDAPRPPHEAYPTLIAPPSLRIICLLEAINGLSLQVDA